MALDPLWTAEALAATVNGKLKTRDWQVMGVSIDSRTVQPRDLFVALAGTSDGHAFVKSALDAGAAGALVIHKPESVSDERLIKVSDTRKALAALGRAARARVHAGVGAGIVAVTGSVGKTGTKEALRAALGRFRPTHASAASYNNDIGVPLSLARMPAGVGYGVFELGMNHEGELTPLSLMVRPQVALITNVEAAHIEFFTSVEAIADAKAEVFAGLQPGGTAVLNRDNTQFARLAAAAEDYGVGQVLSFGFSDEADVRLKQVALHETCSCITADVAGQVMTYKVGLPGRHWVANSLGVLAVVKAIGADLGLAGLALAELAAAPGRGQRYEIMLADGLNAKVTVIDESYNANPASMRAAIETLGQVNIERVTKTPSGTELRRRGRRIAVLGDMAELGLSAASLHAELAEALEAAKIDLVFTAGQNMAHLAARLSPEHKGGHAEVAAELGKRLLSQIQGGDVIMIKGSNSTGMGVVVDAILALGKVNTNKAAIG
jgi:UDP-N-acetylmuramoyl-tripeptide--D-alanyl-D-alanine ligase